MEKSALIKNNVFMNQFKLDDLEVYLIAMELGDIVWDITVQWDSFSKFTLGKQVVKSADSIANNISEGYGRFSNKENIHFCYIARGSLFETATALKKATGRGLIDPEKSIILESIINKLFPKLNSYINHLKKITNQQLNQ